MTPIETALIPGLDNNFVVVLFGIGTAIFCGAMAMFYKTLKRKRLSKSKPTA